ncbi:precorrin-2 dehydrogenase/sirohydrochlorin ferrochelatase family protein [Paenibacillus abyssi]|uniref:precorrin-2 dehydrogenase n=1 Tax=Paenibacillus abyssi TaxID=1340531 RepID=A0A917G2X9_9BACL|nr:bifunctional precorrin-2 dehydrogenase/sirohydrochlorin ferrochelatase [Paenibacillus abyssi]GGG20510.1 precorrin-2 oxidase [Paenibacillus abyssi]
MNRYYPIMLNVEECKCVVVGGGSVAARKVEGLLESGAEVVVVSPAISAGLRDLANVGAIRVIEREYLEQDIDGAQLVFAATDQRTTNAKIAKDARSRMIPVNVADAADTGSFIIPSIVRRGGLLLAVSTSGASPALSIRIKKELEQRYGQEYESYTKWLGNLRIRINKMEIDERKRRELLREALDIPPDSWNNDQDEEAWERQIAVLMQRLHGRDCT